MLEILITIKNIVICVECDDFNYVLIYIYTLSYPFKNRKKNEISSNRIMY